MAIKLYYNKTTYVLIGIDDNDESIVVGDNGSKEFQFYFGTGTTVANFVHDATWVVTYEGRVLLERPDGITSNYLYATPITGSLGGYYKLVVTDWISEVEGDLLITARTQILVAGEYVATNYGVATIAVEYGVEQGTDATIAQAQYEAIQTAVDGVIAGTTDIVYDNATSGLTAITVQDAIDEVDGDVDALDVRVTAAEADIVLLDSSKENLTDANTHRNRTTALETANMIKSIVRTGTDLITITYYDTTTATVITLAQLKAFIGEATISLSGLMSATDKTNLTTLMALFDTDADAVVNTIAEVLTIFASYPEGADLVTALAAKVDKDISGYTTLLHSNADGLEEFYLYDGSVAKKMTLDEVAAFANTATGAFVSSATYTDLTSGASIFTLIHDLAFVVNGDFKIDLDTITRDKLVFVIFPTTTSTSTLRVSVDDGTTYYNVLGNGSTMRASTVSGQLVRLQFDGTQFIADIQGDVAIEETYTDRVESTYGQFAPQDGGSPLVKEISGCTIPALSNLVSNGDTFASDWVLGTSTTLSSETLIFDTSTSQATAYQLMTIIQDNVYYIKYRAKSVATGRGIIILRNGTTDLTTPITTPSETTYQILGQSLKPTGNGDRIQFVRQTTSGSWQLDNIQLFNLTALFGVTATTGTAYDNAVADIEAQLEANSGYISTTARTSVENTQVKATGKNLFDKSGIVAGSYYNSSGVLVSGATSEYASQFIRVNSSTAYVANKAILVTTYDAYQNFIARVSVINTFTTGADVKFIKVSHLAQGLGYLDLFQLEQGTVATTYEAYVSETQSFIHTALHGLPNLVADKLRYDNGAYVRDNYTALDTTVVKSNTSYTRTNPQTISAVFYFDASSLGIKLPSTSSINLNNCRLIIDGVVYLIGAQGPIYIADTVGYFYIGATGIVAIKASVSYATADDFEAYLQSVDVEFLYELATPLLATEVIDVDGTLIQGTVTTVEQLQNIPTTYKLEYAMNVEQTTKTLVERDKIQQLEIDNNEANIVTLLARKTTTNDIIIMSATAWSTYTEVTGEVYGVYNESTFIITWYYGQTA